MENSNISFREVSFSYGDTEVLHQISFDAAPCGMTAIVGPSGSGKSTVARLIASFWEADSGEVQIGGVDVRRLPLKQVMDLVSYVSQDNFLFHLSVKENIRIGRPGASDEEVIVAANRQAAMTLSPRCPRATIPWRVRAEAAYRAASGSALRLHAPFEEQPRGHPG